MKVRLSLLALWGTGFLACADEFTPYNELVQPLRVLGVRADPPWLFESQTATLTALLYQQEPLISVEWSWCPIVGNDQSNFECLVTESDLQEFTTQTIPDNVFRLGTSTVAALPYFIPEDGLRTLCETLKLSVDLPNFVDPPDCDRNLPVTVELAVETPSTRIRAQKEVLLMLGDEPGNQNPTINGASVVIDGREVPLQDAVLAADKTYPIILDIPEASAETYVDEEGDSVQENLVVTWFIEGGETDFARTTYRQNELPFEGLLRNEYTADLTKAGDTGVRLYFVIRDGRGGIGWLEQSLQVQAP